MRSFQSKGEPLYFALSDSYMYAYFVQAINARIQMNHISKPVLSLTFSFTNKHSLKTTFIYLIFIVKKKEMVRKTKYKTLAFYMMNSVKSMSITSFAYV